MKGKGRRRFQGEEIFQMLKLLIYKNQHVDCESNENNKEECI
jgi:hypothetical protein